MLENGRVDADSAVAMENGDDLGECRVSKGHEVWRNVPGAFWGAGFLVFGCERN